MSDNSSNTSRTSFLRSVPFHIGNNETKHRHSSTLQHRHSSTLHVLNTHNLIPSETTKITTKTPRKHHRSKQTGLTRVYIHRSFRFLHAESAARLHEIDDSTGENRDVAKLSHEPEVRLVWRTFSRIRQSSTDEQCYSTSSNQSIKRLFQLE